MQALTPVGDGGLGGVGVLKHLKPWAHKSATILFKKKKKNAVQPSQCVLCCLKSKLRPPSNRRHLYYCLPHFHDRVNPCVHGGSFKGTGCMYCAHTEHCWSLVGTTGGKGLWVWGLNICPAAPCWINPFTNAVSCALITTNSPFWIYYMFLIINSKYVFFFCLS